ncbi:hypothetical protein C0J52_16043 [Blattella germanica]|nr:hypothetical protein C0J52_16043 [Blattella germanica]
MVPPITQCINGHNICNDCKPMVNKCPTCMCEFSTVRNRTAEKLSSKVKRPCKYSSSGCEEKLSLDELAEHERACCFGHYLCPFHIAGSCNWEGFFGAIKQHVQMSHSENMKTIQNENHLVCLRNYKYVDKSREACIVMLRNDIFFRYSLFLNDYMHICIMFVGPLNPAIDYMYNVTLKTADGMESVVVMDTMARDFNEALLIELECPVCLEYMLPPIFFCENGHNICSACRTKLVKCPSCRRAFVKIRNLALENIIQKMEYPCTNRTFGCQQHFPADQIKKHQEVCPYIRYQCPLNTKEECTWVGSAKHLKTHLLKHHSQDSREQLGPTRLIINTDSLEVRDCKAMFAFDEIFYIHIQRKLNYYYIAVRCVGTKETASKFGYKISFKNNNTVEELIVCNVVRSVSEEVNNIFESGTCFKFPIDILFQFQTKEANLSYTFEIFKASSDN